MAVDVKLTKTNLVRATLMHESLRIPAQPKAANWPRYVVHGHATCSAELAAPTELRLAGLSLAAKDLSRGQRPARML